jgi:hypothetical protein
MNFKFLFLILITNTIAENSQDPSIITIDELPKTDDNTINTRLMPYVGNGHLASTIFDDSIYVNGLYNGQRGVSHRGKIPNMHNFDIKPSNGSANGFIRKSYSMDFGHGMSLSNRFRGKN